MSFKKFHSKDLRKCRLSDRARAYLVTTSCQARKSVFSDANLGAIVADEIRKSDQLDRTSTFAFVVMPDHLHWLVQLHRGRSLSAVVRRVKGRSSYRINKVRRSSGRVWQPDFHDRAIRKEESLRNVGNYIILNPVRAGLVDKPEDYPLWDLLWGRSGDAIRG